MALYIENATAYNYKASFEVDGNLVNPTSATITLTKNDGTVVGGINGSAMTIASGATSSVYAISGANNTATLDHELRYITVAFVYQTKTYYIRTFYTLRANLRIPVTPEEVRSLVGLTESELGDDQIDLFAAYDEVKAETTAALDTVMSSGSTLIPYAQIAIRAKAAMNSMTFIESMVFQSEQADNTLYKRFSKVDFQAGLDRLASMYSSALSTLNGDTLGSVAVTPFLVVTGTDPVTNT